MLRTTTIILLIALIFCAANVGAQAWVCGNVNNDSGDDINVADLTWLIAYFSGQSPAPVYPQSGDVDNRQGLCPPDATHLIRYFFGGLWGTPLNCVPTQTYTYAGCSDDTIFIPRMSDIPEGVDEITLPITFSAAANTIGFYIPTILNGAGSSGNFSYKSSSWVDINGVMAGWVSGADTSVFFTNATDGTLPTERTTYYYVTMQRDQPGIGSVQFEGVDFSVDWPLSAIKDDYDMCAPTIQYVDIKGYGVELSSAQLDFNSIMDFPPPDVTHTVEVTSPANPINWSATHSAAWLNIDFSSGTTPSSMNVTVDPTGLTSAVYVDTIRFFDDDNPLGDPALLPVVLTVNSTLPSMDANCDGTFNISDLAYIVNYLFGRPTGPAPCNPCTGTFPESE